MHRLWGADGDQVDFQGEHYRLEACPALPSRTKTRTLRLIMGGEAGPRSAALAARWADEYDLVYVDPPGAKERVQRVSAACEAIGRDPGDDAPIPPDEDDRRIDEGEVRRRAAELMAWQGEDGDVDAYLDDLRTNHVAGTVEQVLERLAEFAAAGIQKVLVHQLVHTDLESVELIGREIVPEAARL